ncbi:MULTISPECIES: DUF6011 domain-containing protein [unclassified Streptomyces]|uniref:DUF6011 domain-containing protein n=1 Tax=unclassified Streptomyces TaxID=2593676 RepID=UPI002DD97FFD|nr:MULTISPECIES: DUF6011 domain-containing protein [unclassified Streptomyces]WSA96731.1 DUF6011 domain-containing protein [Streptomyces sp. NBC_01795]WSB81147.1 DUF6011 domain-containing protein [Streptomyces sp. NBC_01775]WSS10644.1 DUF6011 domain-containing protein [Streptomyces sp. NBC_01186]WSS39338.1 DUF6011 domain-containing protein [Streptomyces sp. NBC_01187]
MERTDGDEGEAPHEPALPGSELVEGRRVLCRMCGQPLRDRASRIWGLGPDCRHKLAVRTAPAPPAHEVEQDALPGL